MTAPYEPFFMPIRTAPSAPYFDSNAKQLHAFLQEVDQLSDKAGISQESWIKYAVRYADPNEADIWKDLDEYTGNSYEDFTNAILQFYPECGPMHYVSARPTDAESPEICELTIQDEPIIIIVEEVVYDVSGSNPTECAIIEDKPALTTIPKILDLQGNEIFKANACHASTDTNNEDILMMPNETPSLNNAEINEPEILASDY
ncbi:hypothetical protein BDR04DRAFT_1112948 [Suillus decipiens]|nr:hypothetical protein BDR04DRAFT_1112948 [Suillus decipiens]